jgi:hypothetical protein
MLWIIFALLVLLGQNSALNSAAAQVPSCRSCSGKRIAHTTGTVLLCVPHGMKVHRDAGFEGDIRDTITLAHRKETATLTVYSSTNPSGYRKVTPPDWFPGGAAGQSSVRDWQCPEGSGRDFRLTRDGRYWRMITFPLGSAEYSGVSATSATQFDRVLDSLCCRPFTALKMRSTLSESPF